MQAARKYESYEHLLNPVPREELQRVPKHRKKPKRAILTLPTVCFVLIVFVAMTLVLVRYAALSEQKVHNFKLKSEVKALQTTRDELIAQRDRSLNLEKIESSARQNLGMQFPVQSQIVYIEVSNRYTLKKSDRDGNSDGMNPIQWLGRSLDKMTAAGAGSNHPYTGN